MCFAEAKIEYEQFELKKILEKAFKANEKLKQLDPKFDGQARLDLFEISFCHYYLGMEEYRRLSHKCLQSEKEHVRLETRFRMAIRVDALGDDGIRERILQALASSLENGKYRSIQHGTRLMKELHLLKLNHALGKTEGTAFNEQLSNFLQFIKDNDGLQESEEDNVNRYKGLQKRRQNPQIGQDNEHVPTEIELAESIVKRFSDASKKLPRKFFSLITSVAEKSYKN